MGKIIRILNRFDDSVLFETEADTIKSAIELAVKAGASLSGANLSGANLFEANLSKASLSKANLSAVNLFEANLSKASLSGANLSWANLSKADLSGATLSGANLSRANLSEADLSGAIVYGETIDKIPLQINGVRWWINITKKHIQIGCKIYEAGKWFEFTDEEIDKMHENALEFWHKNKDFIRMAWENHCKE